MKFINKNKVFIISFFIPFITSIIALFLFGLFPYSDNISDIFTSTGNDEYITYYYKLYDYIHGICTPHNIKDIWAFYLTDPTNLVVLAFPRTMLIGVLSVLYSIKLGLCGMFFSIFISKKTDNMNKDVAIRKDMTIIFLSVAYSLSSYMISYGTNISFLSVIAIFPLIVLSLEKLSSENKWVPYYIILSISFILSFYTTGIVLIFSFLYLFTLSYSSKKAIYKTLLYKLIADILSIGTACIVIIPALKSTAANSFFQKFPTFNARVIGYFNMLHQLFFMSKPSATDEHFYGIDIYIGILSLLCVFIYVTNTKCDIFKKIRKISVLLVLFTGTIMAGPNTIFNFFKDSYTNSCFFLFTLIFYMLLIVGEILIEFESINKLSILVAFILNFVLIIVSMIFSTNYESSSSFIYSLELVILFTILLFIVSSKINNYNYLLFIIMLLGTVEVVFSFIWGIQTLENTGKTYTSSFSYTQYELEKSDTNATQINYELYNDYCNPVLNVINKINYVTAPIASNTPDINLYLESNIGSTEIYSNPYADNRFIYVNSNILDWTYSKSSTFSSMNYLSSLITGDKEDIFSLVNGTPSLVATDSAGNSNYKETTIAFDFDEEGDIYSNLTVAEYLGKYTSGKPITKTYRSYVYQDQYSHQKSSYFYKFNKEAYESFINNLPYVDSNSSIASNGYLINSINDTPLYDITIDGKFVKPVEVDDCLWVVPISSGSHTIVRKCHESRNNYVLLIFISILSIILTLAVDRVKDIKAIKFVYKKGFSFLKENYVYITTIAATTSIVILAYYLNTCIPFGKLSALRSDGYGQTYPAIQSMINTLSLKSLKPSTLDFSTFIFSCGGDPISSVISTIISLIYRAFIPTNDGKLFATIKATIYLIYSGPAIIFYLTHKYSGKRYDKKNPYLILIALLYTLSSYSIGYYIFNNFLYGLYTPMIIWALERMIYKKKPLLYIFFLSFIMVRGYYSAFLLCEFIGLYFLTLDHKNVKDFFKNTLHFLLSSGLAAGLGAFNLMPSVLSVLNSPYRENDTISTSASNGINIFSSVFKTIDQYQVGVKPIYISPDDGMVNIYTGLLPLIFLAIYALNKNVKLSIRIRKLALCFILFWAFGDSVFNFIFHGFHHQSNVPNRFSIFFIFMLINLFSETLINIKDISYKRVMYAVATTTIALVAVWLAYPDKNYTSIVLSILFIVGYITAFSISYIKKYDKGYLIKLVSYISVLELLISAFVGFSGTLGHSNEILEDNLKSIGKLTRSFNGTDDSIFISEYITGSSDSSNMGKVNNLNTISGFSSELSSQVYDMTRLWGINASANTIAYLSGNPLADLMMHVKYQFVNTNDSEYGQSSIYKLIDEQNNMQLYENPYYLPVGFVTDPKVQEWIDSDIENYYSFMDYQNGFSQAVCGKNVYKELNPEADDTDTYINTTLDDSVILNSKNINVEINLNEKYQGKIYIFYSSRMAYVGDTANSDDNHFDIVLHDVATSGEDFDMTIFMGILDEDVLNEMHSILGESSLQNIQKTNTYFTGDIDVKNSGILYLSLPNYSSMKTYIDGKEVPHFDYLKATGINIEKGSHTVKVEGSLGNYYVGVIISIIALIFIIIYNLLIRKISRKTPESNEEETEEITNKTEMKETNNSTEKKVTKKEESKKGILRNINIKDINKTYLLSFMLPFIILLTSIIYSGFSPFGPRDVLTGNDQSDYLRWYFELYDRVHSGNSILGYSTHTGTGYDFSTVLTYYLSDPTNLLILIFPRTALLAVLNVLYVIKVALSGLFMSIYLTKTNITFLRNDKKKEKTKPANKENKKEKKDIIIGGADDGPKAVQQIINSINLPIVSMSLIYAISNYMLGPGFNVAMVGAVMMLPLIMLGLERLVYKNKKKLYIITYAISFLFNFKITLITSLFILLYLPLLHFENIKTFFKVLIKKFCCDIIVVLLAAVVIINNISSSFWRNELTLPEKPEIQAKIFDVVKMLTTSIKPANLLLSGNNLYIYCGIITLLFLFFFIFNNNIKLIYRIKYSLLYVILFVGFMIPSINSILNGFNYHDGIISTYAYVFIFLSIIITYVEYNYLKGTKTIWLIIPAFVTTCLIVASLFLCKSYDDPSYFIKSLEFIFIYSIVTIIYSNKSLAKWLLTLSISLTLIIELSTSFVPNVKTLSWLTYPYINLESYKKDSANDYMRDKFGATMPHIYKPEISTHTPLEITLMGYDYLYWVGEESKVYPTLEYAGEYEGAPIYKSKSPYNSYFISDNIKNYTFDKYSIIDSTNDLSNKYLNAPSSLIPIDFSIEGGNYANGTNYIYVKPSEGGDLYFNYCYVSNVNGTDGENNVQFIQYVSKNRTKYHKGLYKFSLDNYNETINNLTGYSIDINKTNTISTDKKGYITMGLQNRPGWNIKVNGKKVSTLSFMNDGMLIPVEAGENSISFSFTPLLFYIGLIVSIITLIIFILFTRKPSSKKRKKSTNK